MLMKTCDVEAALLHYRNTPPRNHTFSPAQRLFNRRIRTTVPTSNSALTPTVVPGDIVHQEIVSKRAAAKQLYDRSCTGSHVLLAVGDYVYTKLPPAKRGQAWTYGRVQSVPAPRSYEVVTPTGTVRRNRVDVQCARPPPNPSPAQSSTLHNPGSPPVLQHDPVLDPQHTEPADQAELQPQLPRRAEVHPTPEPDVQGEPAVSSQHTEQTTPAQKKTRTRIIRAPERYGDCVYYK